MKNALFILASYAATLALATDTVAAPQVIDTEIKDPSRDRVIPIKVRAPDSVGKVPLVIFSHGLGGSVEGGKAWGEHWAANGYLVVHVQHAGSDIDALRSEFRDGVDNPQRRMGNIATPENLIGRVDDVRFLISEIERQQKANATSWMARADLSRIAMTGHSFGASTTLALAGQRYPGPVKTISDARIKAFIALSPNATGQPRTFPERFGSIASPFLSITGTQDGNPLAPDRNLSKAVANRLAVYEHQPPGDKYLLFLSEADHMVFNGNEQQRIQRLPQKNVSDATKTQIYDATKVATLKFLDAYLRDDASAKRWLQQDAVKVLGSAGEWKSK